MFEHRSLMMRANRLFGANLVEHNLLSIEALEEANTRFLDTAGVPGPNGLPRHLLHVLLYDSQNITEETLINHQVDELGVGMVDLRHIEIPDELRGKHVGQSWATLSVPFDRVDDVTTIATCYHLSPVVRDFWEKELGGRLIWYVTPLDALTEAIDQMRKAPTS